MEGFRALFCPILLQVDELQIFVVYIKFSVKRSLFMFFSFLFQIPDRVRFGIP